MSQPERPVGYLGLSGGVSGGVSTVQVPAVDVPRKSHWVNLRPRNTAYVTASGPKSLETDVIQSIPSPHRNLYILFIFPFLEIVTLFLAALSPLACSNFLSRQAIRALSNFLTFSTSALGFGGQLLCLFTTSIKSLYPSQARPGRQADRLQLY